MRQSLGLAVVSFLMFGCAADQTTETVEAVTEALEMESGGLDSDDEAPHFADSRFESTGIDEEDPELEDPMEQTPEVAELSARPGMRSYTVAVSWGQFPFNPENRDLTRWNGAFAVNRGAILVRRAIRFESLRGQDHLLPREDRRIVPFVSATNVHHDGLILQVIDPDPTAEEPLTIAYFRAPGPDGAPEADAPRAEGAVTIAALLEGRQELLRDELGNQMLAGAMERDECARGLLGGFWHPMTEEGPGHFMGQIRNRRGELVGHLRGIYGVRRSGEQVFFGKYVDLDGQFLGLLRGTYGDGELRGIWSEDSVVEGHFIGRYREGRPGAEVGGHFLGVYVESRCSAPAGMEAPAPEAPASEADATI